MRCEDCGIISDEVEETICPFDWDVHNVAVECFLCPDCYQERAKDI